MVKQNCKFLYQPEIDKVIERYRSWFDPSGKVKYLINIIPSFWDSYSWDLRINVKSPKPLGEYDFRNFDQLCGYIDYELSLVQKYWELKLKWDVKDDMVPSEKVKLGWAESAAAIAGVEPIYEAQSSYIKPIIKNYEKFDFDSIRFNEQSDWAQVLIKGTKYLMEKAKGKFLVEARIDNVNPGDLAYAYRGSLLLTDFYDNSEYVHKLLKKCTEETIKFIEYFYNVVGQFQGGFPCTWNGGYWVPRNIIAHTGDNVSDLVSPNIFLTFLLPYISQLSGYFGGCVFARDASSEHLWPQIPKIKKIKAFKPRNRGSYIINGEILDKIIEKTQGLPLILESRNKEEFIDFKNIVKKNNVKAFFIVHCKDSFEAKQVVDIVRNME